MNKLPIERRAQILGMMVEGVVALVDEWEDSHAARDSGN
jgi:hypothetical protein